MTLSDDRLACGAVVWRFQMDGELHGRRSVLTLRIGAIVENQGTAK
ncbi:hypothetical protein [Actinomadura soli]|nr:hypothetical protein [Actinomadura soli]